MVPAYAMAPFATSPAPPGTAPTTSRAMARHPDAIPSAQLIHAVDRGACRVLRPSAARVDDNVVRARGGESGVRVGRIIGANQRSLGNHVLDVRLREESAKDLRSPLRIPDDGDA